MWDPISSLGNVKTTNFYHNNSVDYVTIDLQKPVEFPLFFEIRIET